MGWGEQRFEIGRIGELCARWLGDEDLQSFGGNSLLVSAICFQMIALGEVAKLTDAWRNPDAVGHRLRQAIILRNALAHDPYNVHLEEIWSAASKHLPVLLRQLDLKLSQRGQT